jgi:hypothetical protein
MRTVIPAPGRDYTSADTAAAAWRAGVDFILVDITSPWDGRPISFRDAREPVRIRYYRLRRVVLVDAAGNVSRF